MNVYKTLMPCALSLLLASATSAQIYESKDAEGNTVFSDQPSAGSEVIKVPETNLAEPVEDIPRPESASQPEQPREASQNSRGPAVAGEQEGEDYIYYGDNDNDNQARERRQEVRERNNEGGLPGGEPPAHVQPHLKPARPAAAGGKR